MTYESIRQAKKSNAGIMLLVSELGGKYELGFIMLVANFMLRKEDAFACAATLCYSILINQHLKLSFAEPRPFFIKPGPPGTPCDDLEYGNPSGHAIAFTSLMLIFYDGLRNLMDDLNCPMILKSLAKLVTWSIIGVVTFSRFYFDVHSLD